MTTELEKAKETLFGADGLRVANFKFFTGHDSSVTPEQVTEELNASLARLKAGECKVVAVDSAMLASRARG